MAKVYIDDVEYEVDGSKNMLEVCLSLGFDLTYFCWHPAMHSVGACRQCAVINYRDANDTRGRITMACMLDARDGTRISLKNKNGHDFRAANIESLMLNHPHDCPVCDEGGECHLQDMTVMSGHNYRRYRFKKRTHYNQDLGSFIYHEMNRCIQCYRCVRFYNDYADGKDFGVYASAGRVYFGRSEPGTLENEFSGNLIEVCPTGVFTDKTLRKHFTRKWDLTNSPSICHGCSAGCNIIAAERYGGLRRIRNRFNGDVNGYFLCDRGRFGYEYVNDEKRLTRKAEKENTLGKDAFDSVKEWIVARPRMIGIGSPRASLESNFLLKQLVGAENFYSGIPASEYNVVNTVLQVLREGGVKTPSMGEAESYESVFIVGEDVTNTIPRLALTLRQTAETLPKQRAFAMGIQKWNDAAIREVMQHEKGPFYIATPAASRLDDIATATYHGDTATLVALGKKVAAAVKQGGNKDGDLAEQIAFALLSTQKPLIVTGAGMVSSEIVLAAANIAGALKEAGKDAGIICSVPEANSLGLAMLGAAGSLDDAMTRVSEESGLTGVILETDLYFRTDKNAAGKFLDRFDKVILLDSMENETTPGADYILPVGTFAESTGTLVNNEGRAQRFYQVFKPENDIRSSWEWIDMMVHAADEPRILDEVVAEMIENHPAFGAIKTLAPAAVDRTGSQKIPRQSHRYSGRTAMGANISVHEPKPPVDRNSNLSYTMEGFQGEQPSSEISYFWSPGWNSVQSVNRYQVEVGGQLKGGNPGKRLIEAGEGGGTGFSVNEKGGKPGTFEVLPSWHIFGSGEFNSHAPALAKRIPRAAIAISEKGLAKAGLKAGQLVKINYHTGDISLPVRIDNSLPENVILLPKGFKETAGVQFPFYSEITNG